MIVLLFVSLVDCYPCGYEDQHHYEESSLHYWDQLENGPDEYREFYGHRDEHVEPNYHRGYLEHHCEQQINSRHQDPFENILHIVPEECFGYRKKHLDYGSYHGENKCPRIPCHQERCRHRNKHRGNLGTMRNKNFCNSLDHSRYYLNTPDVRPFYNLNSAGSSNIPTYAYTEDHERCSAFPVHARSSHLDAFTEPYAMNPGWSCTDDDQEACPIWSTDPPGSSHIPAHIDPSYIPNYSLGNARPSRPFKKTEPCSAKRPANTSMNATSALCLTPKDPQGNGYLRFNDLQFETIRFPISGGRSSCNRMAKETIGYQGKTAIIDCKKRGY